MYGQCMRLFLRFCKIEEVQSVLVCVYVSVCLLYVPPCLRVCISVQMLENGHMLLCYEQLHAQLCVCASNICVVQLRDSNTKQVVFGTVDSTNYVCVYTRVSHYQLSFGRFVPSCALTPCQ